MVAKSALAPWIKAQRKRLGWKSEELAARLRAGGYEVQDTTVRTWEAGRRPSAVNIAALERLFDAAAPGEDDGSADMAGVIAALDRLAKAVEDQTTTLAKALRDGQERQAGAFDGLADGLTAVLVQLASAHVGQPAEPARPRAARQ